MSDTNVHPVFSLNILKLLSMLINMNLKISCASNGKLMGILISPLRTRPVSVFSLQINTITNTTANIQMSTITNICNNTDTINFVSGIHSSMSSYTSGSFGTNICINAGIRFDASTKNCCSDMDNSQGTKNLSEYQSY